MARSPDSVRPSLEELEPRQLLSGSELFAPAQRYDVGPSPQSVAAGKIDDDAVADIVTANMNGTTVSVLWGKSDGTRERQDFSVGSSPFAVRLADIDNDKDTDILATAFGNNAVILLRNTGNRTFERVHLADIAQASGMDIGDFNLDGKIDIAVASRINRTLHILLNQGNGQCSQSATYPTDNSPDTVDVSDRTADGKPDITVVTSGGGGQGKLQSLIGKGDGTFESHTVDAGRDAHGSAAVDITGDGILDVAVANYADASVSLFAGNKDGQLRPLGSLSSAGPLFGIKGAKDVTGDGKADLLTVDQGGTLKVYPGNNDGTFRQPLPYKVGGSAFAVTLEDVSGDGIPDVLTTDYSNNAVYILVSALPPPNRPPVALDDTGNVLQEQSLVLRVLTNDTDADKDALTLSIKTPPARGTATVQSDGSILYTPAAGFSGEDILIYEAGDGKGGKSAAKVTVTVAPKPVEKPKIEGPIQSVTPQNVVSTIDQLERALAFSVLEVLAKQSAPEKATIAGPVDPRLKTSIETVRVTPTVTLRREGIRFFCDYTDMPADIQLAFGPYGKKSLPAGSGSVRLPDIPVTGTTIGMRLDVIDKKSGRRFQTPLEFLAYGGEPVNVDRVNQNYAHPVPDLAYDQQWEVTKRTETKEETVTPSFSLRPQGDKLFLDYHSMTPDLRIALLNREFSVTLTGSGSMEVKLPANVRGNSLLCILDARTGDRILAPTDVWSEDGRLTYPEKLGKGPYSFEIFRHKEERTEEVMVGRVLTSPQVAQGAVVNTTLGTIQDRGAIEAFRGQVLDLSGLAVTAPTSELAARIRPDLFSAEALKDAKLNDSRRNISQFIDLYRPYANEIIKGAVEGAFNVLASTEGDIPPRDIRPGITPRINQSDGVYTYIPMPSEDEIWNAVSKVFAQLLSVQCKVAADDNALQAALDFQRNKPSTPEERAKFAAAQSLLPKSVDRAMERLIAKNERYITAGVDSRAIAVALVRDQEAVKWAMREVVEGGERYAEKPVMSDTGIGGVSVSAKDLTSTLLSILRSSALRNTSIVEAEALFPLLRNEMNGLDVGMLSSPVFSWYTGAISGLGSITPQTLRGRAMLGLMEKLSRTTSVEEKVLLCLQAELATGIRGEALLRAASIADTQRRTDAFGALFNGSSFAVSPVIDNPRATVRAFTDKGTYSSGTIRVQWDLPTGKTISHSGIYLVNGDYLVQELMPKNPLAVSNSSTLFANIPASAVAAFSADFPGNPQRLRWKVVVWYAGEGDSTASFGYTNPFGVTKDAVEKVHGNLSTLRENDPNREIDGQILGNMKFPVAPGDWSYNIASGYHKDLGLFALDLNSENDRGKQVLIAATGDIYRVNVDIGEVIMEHTTGGVKWYSVYEHMTHILEGLTGVSYIGKEEANHLNYSDAQKADAAAQRKNAQDAINALIEKMRKEGKSFTQGTDLAKVGNEGASEGAHLHFHVYTGSRPVDLVYWASEMQKGFPVSATVGGKFLGLRWNSSARALVNETDMIAMQRVDTHQTIDGKDTVIAENLAFAWQAGKKVEEMERVVWVKKKFIDDEGKQQDKETWIMASDQNQRWNGIKFVPLVPKI